MYCSLIFSLNLYHRKGERSNIPCRSSAVEYLASYFIQILSLQLYQLVPSIKRVYFLLPFIPFTSNISKNCFFLKIWSQSQRREQHVLSLLCSMLSTFIRLFYQHLQQNQEKIHQILCKPFIFILSWSNS